MLRDSDASERDKAIMLLLALFMSSATSISPSTLQPSSHGRTFPGRRPRRESDSDEANTGTCILFGMGSPAGKNSVQDGSPRRTEAYPLPGLGSPGEKAAEQLDEKDWLEESRELAVDVIYGPEVMG